MAISFPDIDPVAFALGPLEVRWYALSYVAGFLLGWGYCQFLAARRVAGPDTHPITRDHIDALLTWLVFGVLIGGRLGYVLFYNPAYYFENPGDVVKIWHGGMAFHGGLVGAAIAMWAFSAVHKVSLLVLFDLVAAAAPIGIFFGRIANFINGELFGRPTDMPWGIVFPYGGNLPRHPSQLYEAALEGLLLWTIMFIFIRLTNALSLKGLLTGLFLSGYGIFRIFVELFRMPDEQIGYIFGFFTMGQILCFPMVMIGGYFIYINYHQLRWRDKAKKDQRQCQ